MTNFTESASQPLKAGQNSTHDVFKIGGLTGGPVYAISILKRRSGGNEVLVATGAGLMRSPLPAHHKIENQPQQESDRNTQLIHAGWSWQPVPNSPATLTAVAVSPDFDEDSTLLVGMQDGVYLTINEGRNWIRCTSSRPLSTITVLKVSPNFPEDGIAFLGTIEDGIFISNDRGYTWQSGNFGLFDLAIYSLAISPNFAQDGTLYAGASSGLYYSYNGGRAWQELEFPAGEQAILSIAISSDFANDGTLYAGTENSGLFVSHDRGRSWASASPQLIQGCINALAISPKFSQDQTLLCATDEALIQSTDAGQSWELAADFPDVFCLEMSEGWSLAGLWENSLLAAQWPLTTHGKGEWQPAGELAARALVGLVLSPHFTDDGIALIYGPLDGIFLSQDGGYHWQAIPANLDNEDQIQSVALTGFPYQPVFKFGAYRSNYRIVVATTNGVWGINPPSDEELSKWPDPATVDIHGSTVNFQGNWIQLLKDSSRFLWCSPDGFSLMTCTKEGLRTSTNGGSTWELQAYPWEPMDDLLDFTHPICNGSSVGQQAFLAVSERGQPMVSIWGYGHQGWDRITSLPGSRLFARLHAVQSNTSDRILFAMLDKDIYLIDVSSKQSSLMHSCADPVLSLVSIVKHSGLELLVATGEHVQVIFLSAESWTPSKANQAVHTKSYHFNGRRPLAISLANSSNGQQRAIVLTLGGELWEVTP